MPYTATTTATTTATATTLQMGLFDFFKSRENDFVKLEETSTTYGPGPIILLYNVPNGLLDDEIRDMIEDGTGSNSISGQKVQFTRINSLDLSFMKEMTVEQVLNQALEENGFNISTSIHDDETTATATATSVKESSVPILYFSGISNPQMMATYNIIAREIYEESGGILNAACAKAVEPAMGKCFQQLIEEITGDHTDAMTGATDNGAR